MYEKAKIDASMIPHVVQSLAPFLNFVPDIKNPYFTYALNANSREKGKDVIEILKNILEVMQVLA